MKYYWAEICKRFSFIFHYKSLMVGCGGFGLEEWTNQGTAISAKLLEVNLKVNESPCDRIIALRILRLLYCNRIFCDKIIKLCGKFAAWCQKCVAWCQKCVAWYQRCAAWCWKCAALCRKCVAWCQKYWHSAKSVRHGVENMWHGIKNVRPGTFKIP